jgi:hypothetical protein
MRILANPSWVAEAVLRKAPLKEMEYSLISNEPRFLQIIFLSKAVLLTGIIVM